MSIQLATEGPYFVPYYHPDNGGRDFLGMGQVNLDMMSNCLPGINNVTWYIRPFSVVSWIYWKFHMLEEQKGVETVTAEDLRIWKEKVETLFTWGHQRNGGRVPGRDSNPPTSGVVPLDFAAWKRRAQNTSLMAAVQYGPASKTVDGLGFLEPLGRSFFQTVGHGVELAKALDNKLSRFDLLRKLGPAKASPDQADRLYRAWSVFEPTNAERRVFRRAFFDPTTIGQSTPMGRRTTTLQLAIEALESARKTVPAERVRIYMFRGNRRSKRLGVVDARLRPTWLRWVVLQTRQSQRLAMEGLLAWFERLLARGYTDTDTIVQETVKAIKDYEHIFPLFKPERAIRTLQRQVPTLDQLLDSAGSKSDVDLFNLMENITRTTSRSEETDEVAPYCLRTLFLCGVVTRLLQDEPIARAETQRGTSPDRLSLSFWTDRLFRWKDFEMSDFLRQIFETLILSQHFSVAARRFDGQTQRLRISIEDNGLEFLADKPLIPTVTNDRLNTALSLMADCGLIGWNESDEGYFAK